MYDELKLEAALMHLAIEKTLLNIGDRVFKQVGNRLYSKHKCYFVDCIEHPEYLKDVLEEIFGKGSIPILDSIRSNLNEFAHKQTISRFLVQIAH